MIFTWAAQEQHWAWLINPFIELKIHCSVFVSSDDNDNDDDDNDDAGDDDGDGDGDGNGVDDGTDDDDGGDDDDAGEGVSKSCKERISEFTDNSNYL